MIQTTRAEIFGVHRRQAGEGAACQEASVPITVPSPSRKAARSPAWRGIWRKVPQPK